MEGNTISFKDDFFKGKPLCVNGDCEQWGVRLITPELAKEILLTNGKNRKINKDRITAYTREMKNGTWRNTPDGNSLSFDKEGNLSNGQHRLHSVINSGVSLGMWIFKNTAAKSGALELPFDTGLTRSTSVVTGNEKAFENPIKYLLRWFAKVNVVTADDIDKFVKSLAIDEKAFLEELSKISYKSFDASAKAGVFIYFIKNGKDFKTLDLAKKCTRIGALTEKEAKIKNYLDTYKPECTSADICRENKFFHCYALFEGRKVTDSLKEEFRTQTKAWLVGRY